MRVIRRPPGRDLTDSARIRRASVARQEGFLQVAFPVWRAPIDAGAFSAVVAIAADIDRGGSEQAANDEPEPESRAAEKPAQIQERRRGSRATLTPANPWGACDTKRQADYRRGDGGFLSSGRL